MSFRRFLVEFVNFRSICCIIYFNAIIEMTLYLRYIPDFLDQLFHFIGIAISFCLIILLLQGSFLSKKIITLRFFLSNLLLQLRHFLT